MISMIADNNESIDYQLFSMIIPVRAPIQLPKSKNGAKNMYSDMNNNAQLHRGFSI